jgi:hypothetical protein
MGEHVVGQGIARDIVEVEVGIECRYWSGGLSSQSFYACALSYKRVLSGSGGEMVLLEKTDGVTFFQCRFMISSIEISPR